MFQCGAAARLWVTQGACTGLVLAGAMLVKRINAWLNFLDEDNGSQAAAQSSTCGLCLVGLVQEGRVRGWSNVVQTAT